MSKTYLGVDIGGTAVKLGLVDENGRVLRRAERSVSFDGYKTPILDTVQAAIHEFLTADAPRLEGIAVSATGQIDSRRGVVAGTCGNFPGWIGVDIKGTLERAFGLPVTVANDANCMLLGEVWAGAAKGYTDVIGVTLGTGVGGGILTGGRLLEGARGLGGELGHFRLHALDGVACTCGAIGCYERYAATTALVRSAQKAGLDAPDGRAIFEAAAAGDARTLAVLNGWINEIAQGLAGLVHIFNPQLILIGGGVSAQQALLIDPATWRELFKPIYRKFIDCCHAAGKFAFMHSDGNIEAILPDLVELGLDIGNFQIGCMNLEKVATVAKGKLTFFGEIDRQQVLTKTPEAARTFVRNVARHLYDPAGGIVKELELGVLVEPETALTAQREWDKVDREARQ